MLPLPNGHLPPRHTPVFRPLVVGAHYPGIERGIVADALATRAIGGEAHTVVTVHVMAGGGRVTDVLDVPSDAIAAQFEHLAGFGVPSGVKVGIAGSSSAVREIQRALLPLVEAGVPIVLDLTLSGPSGEDIAEGTAREALVAMMSLATLVTIRRADAELVAGMEIPTFDDAQVAVQRLHLRGASRVLLRCGRIPASAFEPGEAGDFSLDLYYDGEDFALFETPHVDAPQLRGASSALTMRLLSALAAGAPIVEALQTAERFTAEALRGAGAETRHPDYRAGAVATST